MDNGDFERARGAPFTVSVALWVPYDESLQSRALRPLRALLKWRRIQVFRGVSLTSLRGWRAVEPTAPRIEKWKEAFSVSPVLVGEILSTSHPEPFAVLVGLGKQGSATYHLVIQDRETPLAFGRRKVSRRLAFAEHEYLYVLPPARGRSIGTRVLANAVVLYDAISVREIRITAGLSVGSAVWPRMGFRPTDDAWSRLRVEIADRWKFEGRSFPEVSREAVGELVNATVTSRDPRAIWLLADCRAASPEAHIGAGFWLLRGLRWRGILSLEDSASRHRFNLYVTAKLGG